MTQQISNEMAVHLSRQLDVALPLLREVAADGRQVFTVADIADRWRTSASNVRGILRDHGARVLSRKPCRVARGEVLRIEREMFSAEGA